MRKFVLVTVLLVFIIGVTYTWAQETPVEETVLPTMMIPDTESFTLTAAANNREYLISVSLPSTYGLYKQSYPALYLLDPDLTFGTVTDFVRLMAPDELPGLIVGGIGSTARNQRGKDYDTEDDLFLKFIGEELFPFIDTHYSTIATDRAIAGFSVGGQFVLYTLWSKPELFNRYIAISPSTPVEFNDVLAGSDDAFRSNLSEHKLRLFIATGSNEFSIIGDRLREQNFEGLTLTTLEVENATHKAMLHSSLPQAILSQCSKVCQQKSGSNKGLKPLVQHQHFRLMA